MIYICKKLFSIKTALKMKKTRLLIYFLFVFLQIHAQNSKYQEVRNIVENRAAVRILDRWGFIDEQGKEVIPCQFAEVGDFKDGIAKVLNRLYPTSVGYIDLAGKVIIPAVLKLGRSEGEEMSGGSEVISGTLPNLNEVTFDETGKCILGCKDRGPYPDTKGVNSNADAWSFLPLNGWFAYYEYQPENVTLKLTEAFENSLDFYQESVSIKIEDIKNPFQNDLLLKQLSVNSPIKSSINKERIDASIPKCAHSEILYLGNEYLSKIIDVYQFKYQDKYNVTVSFDVVSDDKKAHEEDFKQIKTHLTQLLVKVIEQYEIQKQTFYSLNDALKSPEKVKILHFEHYEDSKVDDIEKLVAFPNLESLSCYNFNLTSLPKSFLGLAKLKNLQFSNCKIDNFSTEINTCKLLETIYFYSTTVKEFTCSPTWPNLKTFEAEEIELSTGFLKQLCNRSNLERLSLTKKLKSGLKQSYLELGIPKGPLDEVGLRELGGGDNFSWESKSITRNLKSPLLNIVARIPSFIDLDGLTALKELFIQSDSSVFSFRNADKLEVFCSEDNVLPDASTATSMTGLKSICYAFHPQLHNAPDYAYQCKDLDYFEVVKHKVWGKDSMNVFVIDERAKNWTKLNNLQLGGLAESSLPDCAKLWTNLRTISFGASKLPNDFATRFESLNPNMTSISFFSIGNWQEIDFTKFSELEKIEIANRESVVIPESIFSLKKLKEITLLYDRTMIDKVRKVKATFPNAKSTFYSVKN